MSMLKRVKFKDIPTNSEFVFEYEIEWEKSLKDYKYKHKILPYIASFVKINDKDYIVSKKSLIKDNRIKGQNKPINFKQKGSCSGNTIVYFLGP